MIVNAFSESAINFVVDYFELPNSIYRFMQKYGYSKYSQKQCNEIYELNDSDIPAKYAYMIKTFWLTCFYGPFVPIVVFVSLAGLTIFYFSLKVSFRHFYRTTSVRSS
jgi:uncharacterized membrane protein